MKLPSRSGPTRRLRRAAVAIAVLTATAFCMGLAPANASTPVVKFTVINNADGICLDANDAGPTAGQPGDKVQLWTCSGSSNQSWLGYFTYVNGVWKQEVHNAMYPNMCLSLTAAPATNNSYTLQTCGQYYALEYLDWYDMLYNGLQTFPVMLAGDWVMAAQPGPMGPGDPIVVGEYGGAGATYQAWRWTSRTIVRYQ